MTRRRGVDGAPVPRGLSGQSDTPTGLLRFMAILAAIPIVGTVAFMVVEGWDFLDSLYMSVITLTTVGFHEVHPLDTRGRILVILYVILGLGIFLFGLVHLGELVLRGQLASLFGGRKMDTALKSISSHVIVCGCGRMGRTVCEQLAAKGQSFVAVDRGSEAEQEAERNGWHFLAGDATDDRVLVEAGLERARGLAAVLSNDADNLYVTLTAHLVNPAAHIIARATDEPNALKMRRAGASRVISPYKAGAQKIAQLLTNANLEDFLEIITTSDNELDLVQFKVPEEVAYAGRTLAETDFRLHDIIIVGIRKPGGEFVIPPPSSTIISAGDTLMALGKGSAIAGLIPAADTGRGSA